MFRAWQKAFDWLSKIEGTTKEDILKYVMEKVQFVWYQLSDDDDPYETFESLNSGKIALTNAELLKALLFRNRADKDTTSVKKAILSQEWDRIEQRLRDDAFWYFINPDAKDERFASTRIDFLFEVVLRREMLHAECVRKGEESPSVDGAVPKYLFDENWKLKKRFLEKDQDGNEIDVSYVERSRRNPYFSFSVFSEFVRSCKESPEKKIWDDIKTLFRVFDSWYENKAMFHLVGFLINRRDDNKFGQLLELVDRSRMYQRSDFRKHLLERVKDVVLGEKVCLDRMKPSEGKKMVGEVMAGLSYENGQEDKRKIHNILLLFNVALTDRWDSEDARFPFHKHANMSDKWSLEHIHAKEESFDVNGSESSDLFRYEEYLRLEHRGSVQDRIKLINDGLEELKVQCSIECKEKKDADADGEYEVSVRSDVNRHFASTRMVDEMSNVDLTHGIWNMALLDRRSNSSFNNGIFIRKLKLIKNWELDRNCNSNEVHGMSDYIPMGTKMAFNKEFSSLNTFPLAWTYADRREYFMAMEKVIFAYLTR